MRPQLYSKLPSLFKQTKNVPQDCLEYIQRAQGMIDLHGRLAPKKKGHFLDRLKEDGGDKIKTTFHPFFHIDYTRFVEPCNQIKGLTLKDALATLEWNQPNISRKLEQAIREAARYAKEEGFDLENTYVAEAFSYKGSVVSKGLFKYLKGRGRYGATQHPELSTLKIILQERDRPFDSRLNDPLEGLRVRLRQRFSPEPISPAKRKEVHQ